MRLSSPGSKAIVFSQFVNMLDLIRWRLHSDPHLEKMGLGYRGLHGGMNAKNRDSCLKEFREDSNVRVLLMSLKAGGVALNLTGAWQGIPILRRDAIIDFRFTPKNKCTHPLIFLFFNCPRPTPQLQIISSSWIR